MRYEVQQDKEFATEWRVEAIDTDSGDIYVAVFAGPDAEARARDYAAWREGIEGRRAAA